VLREQLLSAEAEISVIPQHIVPSVIHIKIMSLPQIVKPIIFEL